jgi:amino acid adenylation domain-containing protein
MNPPHTWIEAVTDIAERMGQKIAIGECEHWLTYEQLVARSTSLAAWLVAQGLRSGDRLGIYLRKGIEEIIAILAAMRIGAIFVPIHPQLTLTQLRHIVADAGVRLLITDARRGSEIQSDPTFVGQFDRLVVTGAGAQSPLLGWPALDERAAFSPGHPSVQQIAVLLYTSGSSGKPKGVMHSQQNLLDFANNVACYLQSNERDRVLGLLPVSFGYGLSQVLTTLRVGGTLVLQRSPFPSEIIRAVREEGITGLAGVPTLWVQLAAYLDENPGEASSLSSLRYVTNAGGKLPEATALRLHQHLPHTAIVLMYGSTEVLRSTYLDPRSFPSKPGAIGKAIPNVEVFVIGQDGQVCGPGEQGELVHRGSQVSQGYWNNPDETARRFRRCPGLPGPTADTMVYYSGDVVRIDADGILWFVQRADWMVKSGGFRFNVAEVEDCLVQSGLVAQVAVFPVDDDTMGQVVYAAVVIQPGSSPTSEQLERYCWKSLPSHMVPKAFFFWEGALPLLPNGKLDRILMRERATSMTSAKASSPLTEAARTPC